MDSVTTVIINYQTPDLLKTAVDSFKEFYPDVSLLLVDNGSKDHSQDAINTLVHKYNKTNSVFFKKNMYHGPAMDEVLKNHLESDFVFFLDSDTETRKSGFLEEMMDQLSGNKLYGAGEIIHINDRGFNSKNGFQILLTPFMLIKATLYSKFPPFIHHGQPTIHNFKEAQKMGYQLKHYPVSDYVFHHWRGTANRFGYGLGIKGKVDYLLNKLGF